MYIFHLAKGQENLNSRSKMAHLPLRLDNTGTWVMEVFSLLLGN